VSVLIMILLCLITHLSRELLGEALLLGPLVVVGGGVLFEDLGVFGDEVLAAEGADGHGLCGLDRGAVLVDLHAGAGGVSLLVLAGDAVFLGDRHVERCEYCCWCGGSVWVGLCFGGGKLSKESCRLKVGGDLEGPQKDPEGNFS
jgi:hypothetical protein